MADPTSIRLALEATTTFLDSEGIWYCLTYGTLLGAVREQAIIQWDHDFDLFVKPSDLDTIVENQRSASRFGIEFVRTAKSGAELAYGSSTVAYFDPMQIGVKVDGVKRGDLFAPTLFSDGILRMFDLDNEIIWTPHSSFPHFFLESTSTAEIQGRTYPTVGHPERFLAATYGADWQIPYRSVVDGGVPRFGVTSHSDTFAPKLAHEIDWAIAQGWDRSGYSDCPPWPRRVRGAGPVGPTNRTFFSTGSLWWTGLEELIANF